MIDKLSLYLTYPFVRYALIVGILIALCVLLTLLGGSIPARKAAKQDPVEALRSE